jgi:protein SCO1/2
MFSGRFLFFVTLLFLIGYAHSGIATESGGVTSSQQLESGVANSLEVGDPELDVLWIDEKNGEYIPLETVFNDEEGNSLSLDSIIDKPTVILPVYFYCPSSCSLNLVNLANAVKRSNLNPGKDFNIIAYSFNENEDSENARIAKRNYMRLLPKDFPQENWKFLTGSKSSIDALTQAIGYQYKPLGDGTYIHPSALVVVAEDGMIIKYVYGSFVTGDVDIAISEAQRGTPGISVKRFLAYCFNYDPTKSRSFFQNMKIGALIVFGVLGLLFFMYVRKSDRNKKGSVEER